MMSFAPLQFHRNLAKEPPVPTGQETWWAPEPVWTQWRRKKNPSPYRALK